MDKTLWLTREKWSAFVSANNYELWDSGKCPRIDCTGDTGDEADDYLGTFCPLDWQRLTGIKLKPGYAIKLKITQTQTGFSVQKIGKAFKMEVVRC